MGTRKRPYPAGRTIWSPLLKFLLWFFLRIEVVGHERIPRDGAGIVYYNHIHWLDPVLICGKLKRYAVPLTKIEASGWPIVGHLLRWYHVIFITRGEVDRSALQATWDVLKDGDISVISPEGTRSLDGRLQRAKDGLAFVARQAPEAWLIPCAVTGTPSFKFSARSLWSRTPVKLAYGRPFRPLWERAGEGGASKAGREMLRGITDEAMVQLACRLPDEMRGDYTCAEHEALTMEWIAMLDEPG